jgi:hypothetical protein
VYTTLSDAVARRNRNDVRDALSAFKVAVLWSPDLLDPDAAAIVEKMEARVAAALPAKRTAATDEVPRLPPLHALDL